MASDNSSTAIDLIVIPRTSDIGGFEVRRALPSARRRMVGPFVFLDQMGPAVLQPGQGLDVLPHPHVGLATITYLFEGEILHRDSLGTARAIRPGAVNWMTAGRGIVHSERTPTDIRETESRLFGVQTWVALPQRYEETAPSFVHYAKEALPVLEGEGKHLRLISGSLFGIASPLQTLSETFYADVQLRHKARIELPPEHEERALYIVAGAVELEGERHEPGQLLVLRPEVPVTVAAPEDRGSRFLLFGGEPLEGPRHIWWNFVSSSRERIEQAKLDWREGRFAPVPGESEFIPLPTKLPAPVNYP